MLIVGLEFEDANRSEDEDELAPGLRTYMSNGLVQTPFLIAGCSSTERGGGVFRESLIEETDTNFGMNVGGGVKLNCLGRCGCGSTTGCSRSEAMTSTRGRSGSMQG